MSHKYPLFLNRLTAFILFLSIPSLCIATDATLVDQIGGFRNPVRIVVSSTGDIFTTDYRRGVVTIFDKSGKRIGTLTGLQAPLGLAIQETDPPQNCPENKQTNKMLVEKYEDEVTKFERLVSGHRGLMVKYQAKLQKAQAVGSKQKERRYQQRVRQHTTRVARFEARVQKFEALLAKYDACKALWYDGVPLPAIYVGDKGNGTVKMFERGEDGWEVTTLGSGEGEFTMPNGIAVTADQTVYVVDSNTHQVKVYDNLGILQTTFGGQGNEDGELSFPIDIVINEALGEVYVTDFWNKRVAVFDLAGGWLRNILAPNNDTGNPAFYRPSGLGIDPEGKLYVVDSGLSGVVVMDNTGTLIDIIGYSNRQHKNGQLPRPVDAAADGQRVYVTESQKRVVKIFEM